MESELTRILLLIGDIKKSLSDIQLDICKICRKQELKKQTTPVLIKSTISFEDYE